MKLCLPIVIGIALLICGGCDKKAGDADGALSTASPEASALPSSTASPQADALRRAVTALKTSLAAAQASPAQSAAPSAAQPASGSTTPSPVQIDREAQVVVVGYHRFVERVRHPDTEITPASFEAQLQQIRDAGISVISMEDFLAWRAGEKNIPSRSAIITLDDGWNSAYATAWPILKKFGYPFTLFIYTDYVKGGPKSGGGSMTWDQLGEMRDACVNIESHTVSHKDLRGQKRRRGTPAYEEWLWRELHGSKELLERQLGIAVKALALPYGYYNEHVREVAARAGYKAIFTVYGQKVTYDTPMDALGRYIIDSSKPKLFADAINFGTVPSTSRAIVAQTEAAKLSTEPADGAEITESLPMIKAHLGPLGDVDPASVKMRISGFGLVPAQYDPATKQVSYTFSQKLIPKEYTVFVSAEASGKNVGTRWSFKFRRVD